MCHTYLVQVTRAPKGARIALSKSASRHSRSRGVAGAAVVAVAFVRAALLVSLVAVVTFVGSPSLAQSSAPRPLPDYDGRGPPKTTPRDVVLWIPRVGFAPLYVVSEYVIRRPLGAAVVYAEKSRIPQKLVDFFTFDKAHSIGIIPTAFVDFGVLPSVGVYFFWDKFLAGDNNLRLRAATWGPKWLSFGLTDRLKLNDRATLSLNVDWTRRQDWLFYGLGPLSKTSAQSRYSATIFDANMKVDQAVIRVLRVHSVVGFRDTRFQDGQCCGDPTVRERVVASELVLPPGFAEGYAIGYQLLGITVDTRANRPAPQDGVRIEVEGQPAFNVKSSPGNAWVRYGGSVGGFVDLTGTNRVLSLALSAQFADPFGGGTIPWNEQVVLGGKQLLRGFRQGRLVDRSALVATLQYQWPVWAWLDGTLHVAMGNVFAPRLSDFATKLLRLSSGVGLRTSNSPDTQFEAILGFGTDTYSEGLRPSSVRLSLGATHGF